MEESAESSRPRDLRDRLKALAQPLVDSLDARLREQVDARVDERVEQAVADRLAVIERAIADLDRQVRALAERLGD